MIKKEEIKRSMTAFLLSPKLNCMHCDVTRQCIGRGAQYLKSRIILLIVCYSSHGLNNGPFSHWTLFGPFKYQTSSLFWSTLYLKGVQKRWTNLLACKTVKSVSTKLSSEPFLTLRLWTFNRGLINDDDL